MKVSDLGVLDGPVLVFGGPYSNAQAVTALRAQAQHLGIPASQMICTGDVVAYCGEPAETVRQIRDLGCAVVAGNCEVQLASGSDDCGCGFEEGTACDMLSNAWFSFASQHIDQEQKNWMARLPDIITFHHQGARYAVIHGGVMDVARFIWSTTNQTTLDAEWDALEQITGPIDHIVAGHSGIPFMTKTPRGQWINAGVIGMPPHDGRQQTRFALLDGGGVTIHRLSYDADAASQAMADAGLPEGYRRGLLSGFWPSEDVLPQSLRLPSLASG